MGFKRRSSTGSDGTRFTTTSNSNGKFTKTVSHKTGTNSRVAYTQKSNGTSVETTTRKGADGYITRTSKTLGHAKTTKPASKPQMPKPSYSKSTNRLTKTAKSPPKSHMMRSSIKMNYSTKLDDAVGAALLRVIGLLFTASIYVAARAATLLCRAVVSVYIRYIKRT